MTRDIRNEGLFQTGGTIQADQIAVGRNAEIHKTVHQAGEVLDQRGLGEIHDGLESLLQALEDQSAEISARDEVIDAAKAVAEELKRETPNKLTLKSMLDAIAEHAISATSVVTAAAALKAAVLALL